MLAQERPIAPTQRQAAKTHTGDSAGGRRQPVLLRRSDEIANRCSTLDAGCIQLGINGDAAHMREVDYDAIVAQSASRKIMPTTTNREGHFIRASPPHGVNDVFDSRAESQRCWMFVDFTVPELACLIIGSFLRTDEMAGKERLEIFEDGSDACLCGRHVFVLSF